MYPKFVYYLIDLGFVKILLLKITTPNVNRKNKNQVHKSHINLIIPCNYLFETQDKLKSFSILNVKGDPSTSKKYQRRTDNEIVPTFLH